MTSRTLGNGLSQRYVYKPWNTQGGRLDAIVAGSGTWDPNNLLFTNTIQKLTYEYDLVGNVTDVEQVIDFGNNVVQTQSFTYDALNRLKEASATGGTLGLYDEVYTYDSTTGNLLTKGTRTDLGGQQYVGEYKYNYDANHDHAVASLVQSLDENVEVNSYSYDDNGNMEVRNIGDNEYKLIYDAENRMTEVKKDEVTIAQFTYNGDGQRVKSIINNETIYFVNGYFEQKGSEITKYYLAGASRIAMRKYIVPENMVVTYLLGDHLGSTSITVDATSGEVVETRYKPWGEVRFTTETKTLPTRYTFTGQYSHMSDDATDLGAAGFGLLFYNARWYDPMAGRFAQADSIVPGGVQGLDRYNYVGNNPVRNIDPTGHKCVGDPEECEDENGKQMNGAGDTPPSDSLPDFGQYLQCSATDIRCINYYAQFLGISAWEYSILSTLYLTKAPDAIHAVNYILREDIHITVGSPPFGFEGIDAWFSASKNTIVLNDANYSLEEIPSAWGLTLVAHEALHIEQGTALSHSKLGEMYAWQAQFRILSYFRLLDSNEQAILNATTLEGYLSIMENKYPDYWLHNNDTVGLYTYPDYPSSWIPWWLRLNRPPWWFYW